jgi:hypothetical protein
MSTVAHADDSRHVGLTHARGGRRRRSGGGGGVAGAVMRDKK